MGKIKYLFITGGVCSSLGKGLTAAAIGMLLESRGIKVALLKFDPYLNVDPGTMSPYQHGEVYVTNDGAETDLDLGHYQRFTHSPLSKYSNATSGQIFHSVIRRERKGDYLGKTVQVIPHITDEIKRRIDLCAEQDADTQIVLVEVGGTAGDIESLPFLEAIRQFRNEHPGDCLNIHLTYVPYLKAAGEVKTKPTQHSVQQLREIGLSADIIICRCENHLDEEVKEKISLFCNVPRNAVIEEVDVCHTIYEVPLKLYEQGIDSMICQQLNIELQEANLTNWHQLVDRIKKPTGKVTVGVVGKYVTHQDAYKSVFEALKHGAIANNCELEIKTFEADKISGLGDLAGCDGYLVPGGYGERGLEGKLMTAQYCREENIPYFGICLGMQVMCVEFARNVLGLKGANSTEFDPNTPEPVISLLNEQKQVDDLGGTMRLGAYPCHLLPKSKISTIYPTPLIHERHRHRYEFNNAYQQSMEEKGLKVVGLNQEKQLCEIVEIENHPFMIGVQFHPEFRSRPTEPHPIFEKFIASMKERSQSIG